ncbi:ABC transporter ATP-binding protein [Saccharopolyspora erythraea]|uniref:ABC transporter ATP-binding protein n=1 Tax=Saccharopolyspora erythraea TaxID=1836 RepID=UPI001BF01922|nr:ATP-binding cassette domain-containing protein [Saccharopolyspora erythraea]QUH03887.1 ABC transporter ATP-binding protein [Saccharopolyspora erythraea]
MTELLRVAGLRKSFHSAARAVDDVELTVAEGGSLGLVGESGSGKSTVARMLAGLERPDSGEITLAGESLVDRPRGRRGRLARAKAVQMVFQDPYLSLDPAVTVGRCLDGVLRLHGWSDRPQRHVRVVELLDQVGLEASKQHALPRELSGGQRQRVAIARAVAVQPRLLVLDEAVSALDVSVQAQILRLLAGLRRETGTAQLFISHDLAVVNEVTDTVAVLLRGRVVEQGATRDVLRAPRHPYVRLLKDSIPRVGWDPADIASRRASLLGARP